jgi:hypothetical protein
MIGRLVYSGCGNRNVDMVLTGTERRAKCSAIYGGTPGACGFSKILLHREHDDQ